MHRQAYILLLLTTLFWGGNAVAGKLGVGHVSPMLLTALRWGIAFVFLFLLGRNRLWSDRAILRPHLPLLAGLGFMGFAVFNIALYSAVWFTSAINISIEQAGIPMVIIMANFLLFGTRITALQLAGFFMSLIGVALTASHGNLFDLLRLNVNFGDALMLVAVIVYAAYTVLLRYRPDIHWQSFMIVLSGAAFLTSLPFAIAEYAADAAIWPSVQGWGVIVYTAIFPSILSQVFYVRGVEMIGANRAGLFINLVPIFGTLLSILIVGEAFHAYHGVAMALVLGGIWLAEWSGRRMEGR